MTIRDNPNRGRRESKARFVEQAAEDDKSRLHCKIPVGLHRRLRMMAVQQDTDVTTLVVEALEGYVAERE